MYLKSRGICLIFHLFPLTTYRVLLWPGITPRGQSTCWAWFISTGYSAGNTSWSQDELSWIGTSGTEQWRKLQRHEQICSCLVTLAAKNKNTSNSSFICSSFSHLVFLCSAFFSLLISSCIFFPSSVRHWAAQYNPSDWNVTRVRLWRPGPRTRCSPSGLHSSVFISIVSCAKSFAGLCEASRLTHSVSPCLKNINQSEWFKIKQSIGWLRHRQEKC